MSDPPFSQEPGEHQLEVVEVGAGLVFHKGRLLITQRPDGGHLAGYWEFPGGKREPGESFAECVRREILEELEIEVIPVEELAQINHSYPEKTVHLSFIVCRWRSGEPKATGCAAFAWVDQNSLSHYQFPEADQHLLRILASKADWWGQFS